MSQNITVQHKPSKAAFSLKIASGIKSVFPGFNLGDFTVIHGLSSVSSLTSMLCVQAQLPIQLGGLEGNVVFIDGGKTLIAMFTFQAAMMAIFFYTTSNPIII